MPIYINYAAEAESEWEVEKWQIKNPVHGKNEMSSQEQWRFSERGFDVAERHMTFGTGYMKNTKEWGDVVIKTHAWLSENIEGPWLLQDGWCNHGHSYDCDIYIERFDQRDAFEQSEFSQCFSRRDKRGIRNGYKQELSDLMILKGLAKPISEDESLGAWCSAYRGYWVETIDIGGVAYRQISFDHTGVEESFIQEVGKKIGAKQTVQGVYVVQRESLQQATSEDLFSAWAKTKSGVCMESGGVVDSPQFYKYKFPYKDIEKSFKQNWEKHFHYDASNGLYYCSLDEYPESPVREASPALIEYMYGRGPDPSLKIA